jgi:hypothetical protein
VWDQIDFRTGTLHVRTSRALLAHIKAFASTICDNSATVCYRRVLETGKEDPGVSRGQIDFSRYGRPQHDDEAMRALTRLFSSPKIGNKAHFRCGLGGPTDFGMIFESMCDDLFGRDPNTDYKCWVRRLYRLGLISAMPREWNVATRLSDVCRIFELDIRVGNSSWYITHKG